ncbi:Uncharacterised protein [uncultured archaeon]|nr:Uncharacterised protein [uncultured archaeon]
MKTLIAILSCHAHKEQDHVCRQTWVPAGGYRFFLGRDPNFGASGAAPLQDEEFLDVPDDYLGLPFKTQAACRWALTHGYDFLFKCDNDTYVHVPRLLASGFEDRDYTGWDWEGHGGYCSGGAGYWLSRVAMQHIANATLIMDYADTTRGSLKGEDLQIGEVLRNQGITPNGDERYRLHLPGPEPGNDIITLHDVRNPCKGQRMFDVHRSANE